MNELIFAVEQIPQEGLSGNRVLDPSWFALPAQADDQLNPIVLREPVAVGFRLERSGRDIRVEMKVTTVASLTCARCLKLFPFSVFAQGRFTLCRTTQAEPGKRELELSIEDLESGTFEGDEVDLSALIYEQIVLSLPMKPLCHEGCKGLCPRCGTDQNEESCACVSSSPDPRWETLRRFRRIH
jgi:uncharacterized protein